MICEAYVWDIVSAQTIKLSNTQKNVPAVSLHFQIMVFLCCSNVSDVICSSISIIINHLKVYTGALGLNKLCQNEHWTRKKKLSIKHQTSSHTSADRRLFDLEWTLPTLNCRDIRVRLLLLCITDFLLITFLWH